MLDQRVDFKIAGSTSFQSATLSLKADSLSLCNDGDSDASTRRRIGRVIPFTDLRSVAIEDNDGMQLVHLETKLGHLALRPDAAIPNCVKPIFYKITLRPCLETKKFYGRSVISLNVAERVDRLIFNSLGLAYSDLRITQNGRTHMALSGAEASSAIVLNPAEQTAEVAAQIVPGAAEVELSFEGDFSRQLRGIYASQSRAADGSMSEIAATQFESVDARRAFPCWDEPDFKARFQLTLETPSSATAVSNMPLVARSVAGDGLSRFEFATSPPMSSYLVAFVFGELGFVGDGRVRVYAPPQSLPQCDFALSVAVRVIELFECFFGVEYPLPKLDLVAVPDFASGAMENWGLATFRDSALLCDNKSSQRARERVSIVVTHEIAHMWFGNLVTMSWWTDLVL